MISEKFGAQAQPRVGVIGFEVAGKGGKAGNRTFARTCFLPASFRLLGS
jgi:hypothetical protein